jgi:putative spermidine/putrescine transport system ATP-binding protein
VTLGLATLETGRALAGQAGDAVRLGLRPEALAMQPFEGAANQLAAIVQDVTFLGPIVRLRVMLASDVAATVDLHGDAGRDLPQPGGAVTLWFRADSLQSV